MCGHEAAPNTCQLQILMPVTPVSTVVNVAQKQVGCQTDLCRLAVGPFSDPARCSNPKDGIRKKLQEKSEAAMSTPLQRASKRAPT